MNNEGLVSEICAERDWRMKAISFYKKTPYIYTNRLFKNQITNYWPMCIPMLYAHFEGFVINSFRLLADYITSKNISYSVAPLFLIILANKKRFEYLKGNCTTEQQARFLDEFLQNQIDGIKINSESCISANSNLNFKQFELIMHSFNIHPTNVINRHKQDIEKLVTFRNKIAHGENGIIITEIDLINLSDCIIEIFDELIIIIERYISNETYLNLG